MPLTHRMTGTGAHRSWVAMRQRCLNTKQSNHHRYGGRGITICPEWTSFEQFYKDMGPRPPGTSLNRKDNDGDYTPENCEWADRVTQNNNSRGNVFISFNGESLSINDWSHRTGLSQSVISERRRRGWPPHLILLQEDTRTVSGKEMKILHGGRK